MSENGSRCGIYTNQIFHVGIRITKDQPADDHGNKAFQKIAGKHNRTRSSSENAQSIRGTGISGTMFSDINSTYFSDDVCHGN